MRLPFRRRALLAIAGAIVLIEIAWVAAFEAAARSGRLEGWLARRSDKFVLNFEEAHSFLPFHVRLRGAHLAGQSAHWQWSVDAERIDAEISPWPLLGRRLEVASARGSGIVVHARRRAASAPLDPASAHLLPSIPDYPLFTLLPDRPASTRPPWSYVIREIAAREVREVWIERLRFAGSASATGGFAFRDRREAEIFASEIAVETGSLALAGTAIAPRIQGRIDGRISPYRYRTELGIAVFPHVDLRANLTGEIADAALLRPYLGRATWLEFDEQPAAFETDFRLVRGRIAVGTRLLAERPRRTIRIFGFEVSGEAQLRFEATRDAGGERGDLKVHYNDFDVRRPDDEAPAAVGNGLVVAMATRDLRVHGLPDDATMSVDLGTARIADLASLQALVPASSGVRLLGGEGPLRGKLDVDIGRGEAKGSLAASVDEARLSWNERLLSGRVEIDVPISSHELAERRFDLDGTRVELSGFKMRETGGGAGRAGPPTGGGSASPDWWAKVRLPHARITLLPRGELTGGVVLRLRDSAPLVELYSARKELPGWVERLLTVPDVEANARFRWRRGEIQVDDLSTHLREAAIEGRLALEKESRRGQLLLEWKRFSLGIELVNGTRNLRLRGARDWFEKQRL